MSRVDEELGRRIRRAERPVDASRVIDVVSRKRYRRSIATKVGNGALAMVVLVGTVAGYRVLDRAFGDAAGPAEGPAPSTAGRPDVAERLAGAPFAVCRVTTVRGNFGPGLDTAWVFEEEHTPGWGCDRSEGFQHLAIGNADQVLIMSPRLTDVLGDDAWRVWAFATPDLDGDGLDEITIARQGDESEARHLWFFRLAKDAIVPITEDCGPSCEPSPWHIEIGPIAHENGAIAGSGLSCGSLPGRPKGGESLISWRADPADPLHLSLSMWSFDGAMVRATGDTELIAAGSADGLLPSGLDELCGSPTNRTVDFPTYGPNP